MDYSYLIDDGEIDLNIINKITKYIGSVKTLEYKSSNGLSFVFISEEKKDVFQYYVSQNVCNKITNIFNLISRENLINKKIFFNKTVFNLNFNLFNHLSKMIDVKQEDNIIIWEKHLCLNSFSKESLTKILVNNITKFLWDISKALYGLHYHSILHGDARIDNIGIRNNTFILFDFDGSNMGNEIASFKKDNWDLLKSLEFNIGKETWKTILKNNPYISDCDFILNDMINYISKNKNKNVQSVIEELNTMPIIY
jgi:hypothetical protein